ncbi:MAG: folylpolyglutamate synthase/dihydrofolate synthase family protein [Thermostichales cyanobacterium BF4_bins_65]
MVTWDWQAWLAQLDRAGVILGLERMQALLARLNHPQRGIPVIHVAGTNGKGSVCAVLSEILRRAGYRVGRYTSPHLLAWQERIWVDGQFIAEADWARLLGQIHRALQGVTELYPTQFDVTTAAAWLYFRERQIDVLVLEVGLGGRLDSTNALPETQLAVITSIGMDHWQRLGSTLAAIAGEKAGIIKPGIPTVTAPQVPEVMAVLQGVAQAQGSRLLVAEPAREYRSDPREIVWQGQIYPLALVGPVQLINMGVVLTAVAELRRLGWGIPAGAVAGALGETVWMGRLQRLDWQGREVWLDGAHNLPGAEGLRQFVDQRFGQRPLQWLMGILATKDGAGILAALLRPGDRFCGVGIPGHECYEPGRLVALAWAQQPALASSETLEPEQIPTWLGQGRDPVIIAGSLYLLGALLGSLWGQKV